MKKEKKDEIRILIVEDEGIQSQILSVAMQLDGYTVDIAHDGMSALKIIETDRPDIIILDMNLPDMGGIEIIKKLKGLIDQELIKIVVYSVDGNNSTVLEALSIGATDYAFKKDNLKILKARVSNVVKNITLNRKLKYSLKSLEEGLNIARQIQLSTISSERLKEDSNLSFNILYQPSDYVSGDIYDIYKMSDKKYRIFLADATGHGISAGFVTMSIKTEYDRLKKSQPNVCGIIKELNAGVFNTFSSLTIYSCFVADINLEDMALDFSSSGHPSQLLIQNDSKIELETTNPIIGFLKDIPVKNRTINLESDFRLFLFSDGIFEFFDNKGEVFGLDRFQDLLWVNKDSDIDFFSEQILNNIKQEYSQKNFDDDITLISIKQK